MHSLLGVLFNRYIQAAALAWALAQLIKVILTLSMTKKFDKSRILGSGGMPSSHSSMACALLTTVGMRIGFDSAAFAIAFCFACVVMYDAAGVRRSTGKNAATLNQLMDMFSDENIFTDEDRLKELVGHTPLQVAVGAVLGIAVGFFMASL